MAAKAGRHVGLEEANQRYEAAIKEFKKGLKLKYQRELDSFKREMNRALDPRNFFPFTKQLI